VSASASTDDLFVLPLGFPPLAELNIRVPLLVQIDETVSVRLPLGASVVPSASSPLRGHHLAGATGPITFDVTGPTTLVAHGPAMTLVVDQGAKLTFDPQASIASMVKIDIAAARAAAVEVLTRWKTEPVPPGATWDLSLGKRVARDLQQDGPVLRALVVWAFAKTAGAIHENWNELEEMPVAPEDRAALTALCRLWLALEERS
jgi:hypothetical protein